VYLADKNEVPFQNEADATEIEEITQSSMVIYTDETIDGEYVTMLENIISDKKYSNESLSAIKAYEWYLTDNINNVNADKYFIEDGEIVIFAADDSFIAYVNEVLSEIITD
jgi:hypothetical protein